MKVKCWLQISGWIVLVAGLIGLWGAGSRADIIEEEINVKKLEAQCDQILSSQEQMFQRLDQLLEEARIIKVRASSRSSPTD